MSIVDNVREPGKPGLSPGPARLIGLLAALAVSLGQIAVLATMMLGLSARLAAEAARHGAPLWWQETNDWLVWPVVVSFFLPLALVPGAFGWSFRQLVSPTV